MVVPGFPAAEPLELLASDEAARSTQIIQRFAGQQDATQVLNWTAPSLERFPFMLDRIRMM
jgi:hypothetical protein